MLQLKTISIALLIKIVISAAFTSENLLSDSEFQELEDNSEELRTIELPARIVSLLVDILQPDRLMGYLSLHHSRNKSQPEADKINPSKFVVNSQQPTKPDELQETDTTTTTQLPPPKLREPRDQVAPVDELTRKQNCTTDNRRLEVLRAMSYGQDSVSIVNLSHGFIYRLDSEAFAGQHFEYIDLSDNRLGVVQRSSFLIGPKHSPSPARQLNSSGRILVDKTHPTGNPAPPTYRLTGVRHFHSTAPSITIDFSDNPFIVAMPGAFDHIDVPRCLLNFTGTPVEFKFAAFKKYLMAHPGHLIEADQVNCCEQEWLLNYRSNFLARARCVHDPSLVFNRASQSSIIESCVAYVISGARSGLLAQPESTIIHQVAASIKSRTDTTSQRLNYLLLGGTAMVLSSLSIYVIFYMLSFKAAIDNYHQMQQHKS